MKHRTKSGIETPMKLKPCQHRTHSAPTTDRLEWAIAQIREKGMRVTTQRTDILMALLKSPAPLSAEEIYDRLKKGASDIATVFRSVGSLEDIGLLQRHDLGDGIRRYEVALNKHHHHFIHCRSCGSVEAFDGCDFEEVLSKTLARKGYQNIQHNLEVKALCPKCAA